MTEINLEEIRARDAAAIPGPWNIKRVRKYGDEVWVSALNLSTKEQCDGVMEFITHARQDIPALIAEVELLGKYREASEATIVRTEKAEQDLAATKAEIARARSETFEEAAKLADSMPSNPRFIGELFREKADEARQSVL